MTNGVGVLRQYRRRYYTQSGFLHEVLKQLRDMDETESRLALTMLTEGVDAPAARLAKSAGVTVAQAAEFKRKWGA